MTTAPGLTRLLRAAQSGDREAADAAYSALYTELRTLARSVRSDRPGATLQTTGLVHEAWIKLAASPPDQIVSRAHFKRIAARAMRQVLIEEARARNAAKRGGPDAVPVTYEDRISGSESAMDPTQLLTLHEALEELAASDHRAAQVVECRFFGGMEIAETAEALDVSTATVKRDWRVARAWLSRAIAE